MPGVLIIEALAQVSALLVAQDMDSTKNKEVFFMAIEGAKFRRIVRPGDQIKLFSEIIQTRANVWRFKVQAKVDGGIAAESMLTAMVKEK